MTTSRAGTARLLAAVALVAGLTGCGAGGTQAACAEVKAEIADVNAQGMTKISDPAALKQAYENGAAKIRAAAEGTDIEDESAKVAAALETLGDQVAAFAANPSTTMPDLDGTQLTQAGAALQKACS